MRRLSMLAVELAVYRLALEPRGPAPSSGIELSHQDAVEGKRQHDRASPDPSAS